MKKEFCFCLIVISGVILFGAVFRALNGLAFNDFGDRLFAFVIFIISIAVFMESNASNNIYKLIVAFAALALIAPSIIGYFVPEQDYYNKSRADNSHEVQPRQDQNSTNTRIVYPPISTRIEDNYNERRPRPCNYCSGTGMCMKCNGIGSQTCHGTTYATCINGRCASCHGTGLYNHGTYTSRCIVCSGRGICSICNGRGKVQCGYCHGRGKCNHCNGSGKI